MKNYKKIFFLIALMCVFVIKSNASTLNINNYTGSDLEFNFDSGHNVAVSAANGVISKNNNDNSPFNIAISQECSTKVWCDLRAAAFSIRLKTYQDLSNNLIGSINVAYSTDDQFGYDKDLCALDFKWQTGYIIACDTSAPHHWTVSNMLYGVKYYMIISGIANDVVTLDVCSEDNAANCPIKIDDN